MSAPQSPPVTDWPKRIRSRAASIPGGDVLLELASEPGVLDHFRHSMTWGMQPMTTFSGDLIERIGIEAARNRSLKQLAGEITSYLCETKLGAVRGGSAKILDDQLFASGTVWRLPGTKRVRKRGQADPLATELVIRHLTDEALDELSAMIDAEFKRRRK